MPNLLDLVSDLANAFERMQLRYALGGALANGYWGIVRTTQDVDFLVSIPALKYQLLVDELNSLGCTQLEDEAKRVEVTVARMRSQVSSEHLIECFRGTVRIELFIPVIPLQEQILQRAVLMPVGEREVWVTTAEDLILLKLAFHRAKDLQDVRGILWVQRGHLDVDYLTTWGAKTLDAAGQNELDRLITESNQASKE